MEIDAPETFTEAGTQTITISYGGRTAQFNVTVQLSETIKTIECVDFNSSLRFTVTTVAGEYNRLRCGLETNLQNNLTFVDTYTVNDNNDYVWIIMVTKPNASTTLYFDLRSSVTGYYIQDYATYSYNYEASTPTIKSVVYEETTDNLVFTVTTKAGDYNRLRCGLETGVQNNLAVSNTYIVNANGDYVWTISITKPTTNTTLYFDLRDGTTNHYINDYYVLNYEV